jgi:phosphotransferase system enzyme I (PtsI)
MILENKLEGLAVSEGYGIGTAYVYKQNELVIDKSSILPENTELEFGRFLQAKDDAGKEISEIIEKASQILSEEEAKVFKAHMLVLKDPKLQKDVKKTIETKLVKVDNALEMVMDQLVAMFSNLKNEMMRERALDIQDVCTRMLYILTGTERVSLSDIRDNTIIVANNLTPSDSMQMDISKVAGLVVEMGGRTSHTSILARSLEIPAVVGVSNAIESIITGEAIKVDGIKGEVWGEMTEEENRVFAAEMNEFKRKKGELEKFSKMESVTKDGRIVEICANIGSYIDCKSGYKYGLDGVGLFRTEFLYMGKRNWPTEEEQFIEYKRVAELMGDKGVIVRTLDIGGDKELSYFDFGEEENPFLGWRAIRMCLDKKDIFKTQLKAILRASAFGKLRIMYPMVSAVNEVKKANEILEEAKEELRRDNIDFDVNIEVGIMVETPAAAMVADKLIKYVDFFSIGTNDLTQYTLAVDRGNDKIANLYRPYHPAVLRLIKRVVDASHDAGKWTGMCGEFAGSEPFTDLLVGIGLDELSMSASSVLKIRKNLVNMNYAEARKVAEKVLDMETAEEIINFINNRGE